MDWSYRTIRLEADRWSAWAAVVLGVSIPISTALDDILLALILALWLIGARLRDRIRTVRENPITLPALLLFGMYVLGLFYGDSPWREAADSLGKAANLLFVPILISLFRDQRSRRLALAGFLAAMALTLLVSYLMWVGLVPPNGLLNGYPENPYVFKNKVTHNILMAFAAYLFALEARLNPSRPLRILFALLGIAALYNVLFMVTGKTGYIIAPVLAAYYLADGWGRRGIVMAALFLMILGGAVYLLPFTAPHERLALMIDQIRHWNPDRAERDSVGHRMEYYLYGLELVREHPFLGVGTGGFPGAYAKVAAKKGLDATVNPHNEYLMVAIQLGAAGFVLMLWLFLVQWRKAAALPDGFARPAARGLVLLFLTASLVTSTLIDHTEGLLFVWMSGLLFAGWTAAGSQERSEPCRCP